MFITLWLNKQILFLLPKELPAEIKPVIKIAEYWDNLRFIHSECMCVYFNFHEVKKT